MSQHPKRREAGAEDEEIRQYATGGHTLEELDDNYPNRPRNHGRTLLFSELFQNLFNPLNDNKKKPSGPQSRRVKGNRGGAQLSPNEQRRAIVERFMSRWRADVGNDFYPALRLILPNQDRDRPVYGLKEGAIGKLLVQVLKLDPNSEDGYSLLHWKLPSQSKASQMAGDFAGTCHQVIAKRPMRSKPGDMRVADVNEMLDKLAAASGKSQQLPIIEEFYQRMNADELMWLIRILLKQMRVGATERTFLDLWHPDAEALFSVSSSLRRVCWELYDPDVRLNDDDAAIALMQVFQPQLAQFQFSGSFEEMAEKLTTDRGSNIPVEGAEYWIEEKLDGERMQMHMMEDSNMVGGFRFGWWSRKAKDYSYLYGEGYQDKESALTQHLGDAFAPGVRNIILDGEMVTWNMQLDKIMAFGTLKSAANAGKRNPYDEVAARAIFRVFDILYLNDQQLTQYTLQDRRNALEKAVPGVFRRLECHTYTVATTSDKIEPRLREVIEHDSEGLVLKNPRSVYSLNQRNNDWIKVKPEYTEEFGASVDVVVIGSYYGTGHRGGKHSSFLCGLRATQNDIDSGANPEKCFSFIRVGGGLRGQDYREIENHTQGKWIEWNSRRPPTRYIELAGGDRQYWKPDQWIRPKDSLVIEVKASSSVSSDQYSKSVTLRFPRFKLIRNDRDWETALDWQTFMSLKAQDDARQKEKTMKLDGGRRQVKRIKREIVIAGQDAAPVDFAGPKTKVLEGLEFCVLTESTKPKKSKTQLESIIRENGGRISQKAIAGSEMILLGEKRVVKVASLIKAGAVDIIRPKWVLDCVAQSDASKNFLLPYEPNHLYHVSDAIREQAEENVDSYGDSYARDLDMSELRVLLENMPKKEVVGRPFDPSEFLEQLEEHGHDFDDLKGHMFSRARVHFATVDGVSYVTALKFRNYIRFGTGCIIDDFENTSVTHIVVVGGEEDAGNLAVEVRSKISGRRTIPRIVTQQWLEDCWTEGTMLAEEFYAPR